MHNPKHRNVRILYVYITKQNQIPFAVCINRQGKERKKEREQTMELQQIKLITRPGGGAQERNSVDFIQGKQIETHITSTASQKKKKKNTNEPHKFNSKELSRFNLFNKIDNKMKTTLWLS